MDKTEDCGSSNCRFDSYRGHMDLSSLVGEIPRVGPAYQKKLKKLGIKTVRDLLYHFPHRYEDFSGIIPISQVQPDRIVCVQGKITGIKNVRIFKRRMVITEAQVTDDSGTLRTTWFNQPYLINTFKKDDFVFLAGKMTVKKGRKYLSSPSWEKIPPEFVEVMENGEKYDSLHVGRIVPVYPETEGMSSRWLRFIIKHLLTGLKDKITDGLPEEIKIQNNLPPIKEALWQIHFPDSLSRAETARNRFVFEQLFNLAVFILREKIKLAREKAIAIPIDLDLVKGFTKKLPFLLTNDQKKAAWQILKDMQKSRPMNRLLDGDVGSGKTVVALIAALNAAKAGFQAAFMAPTEILAKQHLKTVTALLKGFKINLGLICGKENSFNQRKCKRKELLEKTKKGEVDVLIGTHAIIQENVKFKNLGLAVIDEQHRFGVDQRMKLCQKQNFFPHLLSMSATPIPRTLALTVFGDLDLSLIKEMPRGRKKVITQIVPPEKRSEAYDFVRKEVGQGRQVFVICPRIDPGNNEENVSGWAEVKAVKQEYEKLKREIFPDLRVGMLHGRMKTQEKEKILLSFKNAKTDILVSTSVIEVGIDFPNATVILIEGADKFGLAQLHQFRGRVGRGKQQSYCFLFSDFRHNPRLRAMTTFQDGFELAEKDLQIRGPGQISGIRQWGVPDIIMSSLAQVSLVEKTRQAAQKIVQDDPELKKHPLLLAQVEAFGKNIHLE
jgi:ATP-dependent DNA helicase RecG